MRREGDDDANCPDKRSPGSCAGIRTARGLAARAAFIGGCAMFLCACNTDQQVTAGSPDVPNDYRQRHPITMTEVDQTLRSLRRHQPRRAQCRPAGRGGAVRSSLEARGHRRHCHRIAGRGQQRARGGRFGARQFVRSWRLPACRLTASSVRGYPAPGPNIAPIRISYPRITASGGPLRHVAGRHRPEFPAQLFRKSTGVESTAARRSAISPPWSTIQPTWCSRAKKRRATHTRRTTVVEKYRAGVTPATQYPDANVAKISELGK